jgi:ABC-2 type transport system permease protein
MRTFLSVLKNDYLRTVPRIAALAVITIITLVSILLAVYFTGTEQVKGHIALVGQEPAAGLPKYSESLDITVLSDKPPYSTLVQQKYDAFVILDEDGGYQIETLRNSSYRNMLLAQLKNPGVSLKSSEPERGVGVHIIGFMMMLLVMIAFANLFVFADDKEQGQLRRIASTPASFGWYLAAHCIYCLSMLAPEYIMLVVLKLIGWNIGFSLPQYAGLIIVIGFLGTSFGLLLNTLIQKPDNANMLGNSITVLTSILAGCYYSFSRNNVLLDWIIKLLPQKELMDFALYLQNGNAGRHAVVILYTIAFSFFLFGISCVILWKAYVKGSSAKTWLAKAASEE